MPHKDPEARRAYHTEYMKKYRAENPEKVRVNQRRARAKIKEWRAAHPERVREWGRRNTAAYRERNPELVRERDRMYHKCRKYGITEREYHEMVVAQAGRCPICKEKFAKTPHIDHDHESGRIRALLCGRCNVGIAMMRHDPAILDRAKEYLI